MTRNTAEALVDHALGLEWSALDAFARERAAAFLHDTLAVGVAGARAPYADQVARALSRWGGASGADPLVLGRGATGLPPAGAAFLNAFQIHGQEFDAVHEGAVVHPLATVVAVLLAELAGPAVYGGEEVLTAMCAGVDVAVGLGLAARSPLKFFRPATAGVFGCVAALARLKRLPREVALDAFGSALAFAGGTMQAHVEGLPTLPLQIAAAARSAVQAVDLAEAGLPGPRDPIDGPFGYLTLFEDLSDAPAMLAALPHARRIAEVSWKPFPTGRAAHGGLVATRRLMIEQGVAPDTLERLTYVAPPLIHRLVGRRAVAGMSPAYARLCLPYLAAAMLVRGSVALEDFTPDRLGQPEVLALAQRITVESDGSDDPAAFTPAVAVALTRDGAIHRVDVGSQLGSPDQPLTREEQLAKARACMAFAGLEERQEALAAAMRTFPEAADAAAILRAALTLPPI